MSDEARLSIGSWIYLLSVVTENTKTMAFNASFGFEVYSTEPKAMYDGERYYDEHLMVLDLKGPDHPLQ